MKKAFIILCIVMLISIKAFAADYYIKNGGDDSAAGTSDGTAWAFCPGMNDWTGSATLSSGDIVYFRSQDTWTETSKTQILATTTAGVTYDGSTYGTGTRATLQCSVDFSYSDYTMVIINYDNTTFQGFEVDGDDMDTYGIYIGVGDNGDVDNVTVDDCIVHDMGNPANSNWLYGILISSKGAAGTDITDITISDTSVYGCTHEGIAVYQAWGYPGNRTNGVLIDNCTTYDNLQGILIANDSDNVVVQHCNIYNNSSQGIWQRTSPEGNNGSPDDAIVRYNLIHGNATGYTTQTGLNHAMSISIYSNVFYNNTNFDIAISHGDYESGSFKIYNNTIYNTTSTTGFGVFTICPYSNPVTYHPSVDVQNNIIYSSVRCLYDHWQDGDYNNNLIYRTSGALDTHVTDGSNYNRSEVTTWDATAQNTDPLFINPGGDNFRLGDLSDAINNGVDLGDTYKLDYDGIDQDTHTPWEIGAFVYYVGTCGDGTCDSGECISGCTDDCAVEDCCGIEGCNAVIGETAVNCAGDCDDDEPPAESGAPNLSSVSCSGVSVN